MIQLEIENAQPKFQGERKTYEQGNVDIDAKNEHLHLQGDEI
jgi:hypothetical protein